MSLSKDLSSIAFYCGNFYKHCFGPRATGFIFINRSVLEERSLDISHFVLGGGTVVYDANKSLASKPRTAYLVDSLTQGIYDESTRDYSEYLMLPQVLQFRKYTCQSVPYAQHIIEVRHTSTCNNYIEMDSS